jgi:hypothetical protein
MPIRRWEVSVPHRFSETDTDTGTDTERRRDENDDFPTVACDLR